MDARETAIGEIDSAGYYMFEIEMRNLSLATTQVQSMSVLSPECGPISLDRFPIRIEPLRVKTIRVMVPKHSRGTRDVFKVTRDGRVEFLSLPLLEKSQ